MAINQLEKDYTTARSYAKAALVAMIIYWVAPFVAFFTMCGHPIYAYKLWYFKEIGFWYVILSVLLLTIMLGGFFSVWLGRMVGHQRMGLFKALHASGVWGVFSLILLVILDVECAKPRTMKIETPWGTTTVCREPGGVWQRMPFPDYDEKMAKVKLDYEKVTTPEEVVRTPESDAAFDRWASVNLHGYIPGTAKAEEYKRKMLTPKVADASEQFSVIQFYGMHTADYWNLRSEFTNKSSDRRIYLMEHPNEGYTFWQEELARYKAAHSDYVDAETRLRNRVVPPVDVMTAKGKKIAEKIAAAVMKDSWHNEQYPDFDREYNEIEAGSGWKGFNSSRSIRLRRFVGLEAEQEWKELNTTWEEDYPKNNLAGVFEFDLRYALEEIYLSKHPNYKPFRER